MALKFDIKFLQLLHTTDTVRQGMKCTCTVLSEASLYTLFYKIVHRVNAMKHDETDFEVATAKTSRLFSFA